MATTTYEYQVRDRAGKMVTGKIEADSKAAVAGKLKTMGYAPLAINETGGGMNKELTIPGMGGNKVTLKDLAVFSRQFSTMIDSGLSLLRALSILVEQTESKGLVKALTVVRGDVESGIALSSALAKHPKTFPPLMVNMCRAGEVGGFLDKVLLQIADNYEKEVKLRGKVKAAMTYPVVVFVLAILMCMVMLIFIVPTFATMFSSLGATLPAPTRFLVFLSGIMKIGAPLLLISLIVFSFVWKQIKHKDAVRSVVDPIKLKMPVFGPLVQRIALSRFSRNLGTLMSSGVPILQSLDIVAETTGNKVLANAIRDVQESVRSGESLTKPLANHPVFPSMVVQMMAVGEDTGAIDTMLMKISDFYDQEVEATTESLTALIEPLMIAFLGGIVGAMIIALYMPIFKVFDLIE